MIGDGIDVASVGSVEFAAELERYKGGKGTVQFPYGEPLPTDLIRRMVALREDPPALALRGKKDSSMRVAIDLVKSGEADACVSAGNTGALMALARYLLKTVEGIDRPAIAYPLLAAAAARTHAVPCRPGAWASVRALRTSLR